MELPQTTHIESIKHTYRIQRKSFESGVTLKASARLKILRRLKEVVKENEARIMAALKEDFGKPPYESYASEIGLLYEEINLAVSRLREWMRPRKVRSGLMHFPSSSWVIQQPRGQCLIIAPWNYPFQLALTPLVAAIAAGNTVVLKPSEMSPNTSTLIEEILHDNFDRKLIAVVQGEGKIVVPDLINEVKFDHVFFTGSTTVGREIAKMAAARLIPATLELGGKSPAIIDETANLKVAAKRISFGKWLNAGQTCVAPDYLLVHNSVARKFIEILKETLKDFYGDQPLKSKSLASIINSHRFNALVDMIEGENIIFGGSVNEELLRIEPTLVYEPDHDSRLMTEEIFGPVLPILRFEEWSEVETIIRERATPLAAYLFSRNRKRQKHFERNMLFGGGMINNAIVHFANPHLPFGGVGESGYGTYHGEEGFKTFSHQKAVMKTGSWFDVKKKYPPYTSGSMRLIRWFMR